MRLFDRLSPDALLYLGGAAAFLGAVLPFAVLTMLGRRAGDSDADLWFVAICILPTSAFAFLLIFKSAAKRRRPK